MSSGNSKYIIWNICEQTFKKYAIGTTLTTEMMRKLLKTPKPESQMNLFGIQEGWCCVKTTVNTNYRYKKLGKTIAFIHILTLGFLRLQREVMCHFFYTRLLNHVITSKLCL